MDASILPPGEVLGQEVKFSPVFGEVVGVDRQTDTHFETTPGSVVAFGNVVSVTAPTISAHTQSSKCVWVRQENGTELSIAVPDNVQARPGQKVALLITTGTQSSKVKRQWCAIVNYTTGHWDKIDQHPPTDFALLSARFGPVNFMVLWIGGWIAASALLVQLNAEPFHYVILFMAFFMSSTIAGSIRIRDTQAAYRKAVARAADAAFKTGYPERAPADASVVPG